MFFLSRPVSPTHSSIYIDLYFPSSSNIKTNCGKRSLTRCPPCPDMHASCRMDRSGAELFSLISYSDPNCPSHLSRLEFQSESYPDFKLFEAFRVLIVFSDPTGPSFYALLKLSPISALRLGADCSTSHVTKIPRLNRCTISRL